MKSRTMLLVIVAIVAAVDILIAFAFEAFDVKGGTGAAALAVALSAVASAVPLYMVAVRPSARLLEKAHGLSRKAGAQEILIAIDTMAMEAADSDLMLRKVAEDLRHLLDANRCTFWLLGAPDTVVEHRAAGLPAADAGFPLRESPEAWEEICRSEKCTLVEDVRKAGAYRSAAQAMERFGARSFIKAPLFLPEGLIGFLFLFRPEPHSWSDDSALAARAVARRVAKAIVHARECRGREEVSSTLLSLLDHVPGLVYRGQRDWTMSIVSAEIERMIGVPPGAFLRGEILWRDLIHPDDLLPVKMAFRNAVARGQQVLRVEYRARHRNGGYRWFADRRHLIYDGDGRFLYVDGLCLDITERKLQADKEGAATMTAAVPAGA